MGGIGRDVGRDCIQDCALEAIFTLDLVFRYAHKEACLR